MTENWQPGDPVYPREPPNVCCCYIRDYGDWGDVLVKPPGGCPVHSCTCLAEASTGQHADPCILAQGDGCG